MQKNESKYKGIDSRDIKCCCDDSECPEAGISFEGDMLDFHFLEYIGNANPILHQKTKSMKLSRKTANQLIKHLQEIKFTRKRN